MRRGEVWWADLDGNGHERPVVVLQANFLNDSMLSTVLVAAFTSNLTHALAPGNLKLSMKESGLNKPSVLKCTQIFTAGKTALRDRVSMLRPDVWDRVEDALKVVFAIRPFAELDEASLH